MDDTNVEIKNSTVYHHAQFENELPPVLMVESTAHGWRGLTLDGVVLNVESPSGQKIDIPYGGNIAVTHAGRHVGYRAVPHKGPNLPGVIERYLRCIKIANNAMQSGRPENALIMIDSAMSFAPTLAARYSRGMVLLELGRWQEGFAEYAEAIEYPGAMFMRSQYRDCVAFGLERWRGEDIAGKKLLLIHDHGFGDSIMMLRYVPMLQAMGAHVVLWVPPELERLASQTAPVVREIEGADYFCSLLFLFQVLQQTPDSALLQQPPYLAVDPELIARWRDHLGLDRSKLIGVAWSPGVVHENDYPRAVPLQDIVNTLSHARLISVQQQGGVEAGECGVERHSFEDFADCAALMMYCDEVVTIDTAAVHLAGAIGHPRIKLLLSHWASWRWLAPLYHNVEICRQDSANDWASALTKL